MSSDADITARLRRAAESLPVGLLPLADAVERRGRRRRAARLVSGGAAMVIGLAGVGWAILNLGPLGGNNQGADPRRPVSTPTPHVPFVTVEVPYNESGVAVPEGWAIVIRHLRHRTPAQVRLFFASTSQETLETAVQGCTGTGTYDSCPTRAIADGGAELAFVSLVFLYEKPYCIDFCTPPDPLPRTVRPGPPDILEEVAGSPLYSLYGAAGEGVATIRYWIGPEATDRTHQATTVIMENLGLPPVPPETATFTDERRGYSISFPSDWTRSTEPPDPQIADPIEVTTLATFDPAIGYPGCEAFPAEVGDQAAYVQVLERDPSYGRETFPPRPAEFTPQGSEPFVGWKDCTEFSPNYDSYWIPFADAGRKFYAFVAIGPDASDQRVADTWAVVNSLEFVPREDEPQPGTYEDPDGFTYELPDGWGTAHQPLVPKLTDPKEIFSSGTFALRQGETACDFVLPIAARDLGETGAFVTIQERKLGDVPGADPAFAPWPEQFGAEVFRDHAFPCVHDDGSLEALGRWSQSDRYFYVYLAVGPEATEERQAELWQLLDSMSFDRPDDGASTGEATVVITQRILESSGAYIEGAISFVELQHEDTTITRRIPDDGTVEISVEPGAYSITSYQRPCNGSCDALDPPTDRCSEAVIVAPNRTYEVDVEVVLVTGCTISVTSE